MVEVLLAVVCGASAVFAVFASVPTKRNEVLERSEPEVQR